MTARRNPAPAASVAFTEGTGHELVEADQRARRILQAACEDALTLDTSPRLRAWLENVRTILAEAAALEKEAA